MMSFFRLVLLVTFGLILGCEKSKLSSQEPHQNVLDHAEIINKAMVRAGVDEKSAKILYNSDRAAYLFPMSKKLNEKVPEKFLLNADHPFQVRLAKLLSEVDEPFRNASSHGYTFIPKPEISILSKDHPDGKTLNAFVIDARQCLDVPIIWDVDQARKIGLVYHQRNVISDTKTIFGAALDRKRNESREWSRGKLVSSSLEDCESSGIPIVQVSKSDLRARVNWINQNTIKRDKTQCRLSVEEDVGNIPLAVVLSDDCKVSSKLQEYFFGLRYLVAFSTSNTITFHEQAIEDLVSDEKIKAVLAHELVHYYLAHPSGGLDSHGYFYDTSLPRRLGGMPTRNAALDRVGMALASDDLMSSDPEPIEGLEWRVEALPVFAELIGEVLQEAQLTKTNVCVRAYDELNKISIGTHKEIGARDEVALEAFKENISACSESIRVLSYGEGLPNEGEIALALERVEVLFMVENAFLYHCVGGLPMKPQNLLGVFDAISIGIDRNSCRLEDVFAKAKDSNLGFYSSEQVADELAVSFLGLSGLSKQPLLDLMDVFNEKNKDPNCKTWHKVRSEFNIYSRLDHGTKHKSGCLRKFNLNQLK